MNPYESGRSTPERLRIETVPQAVKVIQGLRASLSDGAPHLTEQYWDRRLLGREGGTWRYFAHPEQGRVKIPHFDSALIANETILLGSSIGETGKLAVPYYFNPLKDSEGGVLLGKTGWVPDEGFIQQPRAYIVRPTGIILESIADNLGRTPWEPIDVEAALPLTSVTDELRATIAAVQTYEPSK